MQNSVRMRTYFMRTERLGFSTWTEEDAPLAIALWGDPAVSQFIHAKGAFSREEALDRLYLEMENQAKYGYQYWPIFHLDTGSFAGCCGIRPLEMDKRAVEMGIHLMPDAWGKGLATEATRAAMDYAFESLGMEEIYAGHHPENNASRGLLTKLGFVYRFDSFYPPTGLMHPVYAYCYEKTRG